jgi:mannose-1-phosphate guanylyltransferase/mannose-6-phosphate isomerase
MFMFRASDYLRELSLHAADIHLATQKAFDASTCDTDFRRIPAEEFSACRAESIDYAVMEKTAKAVVLPLAARWNDVGEWDALWELGQRDGQGNVTSGDTCLHDVKNSLIRAESRLVAGLGLENLVVVETTDAVLVADKARVQDVKQLFSMLESQGREEVASHAKVVRPWGSYEGLAMSEGYQVKRIIVNPGGILSLQKHYKRAEHWVVVSGVAKVWVGEEELTLHAGQSTYIPLEVKHRLANEGEEPLFLIEVQCGAYLGEDDIVRYEDVYGRAGTKA